MTDINTIRIYSAIKQGLEKDPQGEFVKRWVPELAEIPAPLIHLPWRVSAMEQMMYQVNIGTDYPAPIVDLSETYKAAQSLLWQWRTKPEVKREVYRLIQRHVRPD